MPKLINQIKWASISIPLNIGESAGKRNRANSRKYFGIAKGSAMECAAALDVCSVLEIVIEKEKIESKQLLHRIVAMLTKLSHSI